MSDIVERLGDIYATDDHARGCQGREYNCTCGYDERSAATAREAAAEITRLRALVDEARGGGLLRDGTDLRDAKDASAAIMYERGQAARSLLNKMGEA